MIRYALSCSRDHGFEGWFKSGAAFDDQARDGRIECPTCGDRAVRKAVMAPAVVRKDSPRPAAAAAPDGGGAPVPEPVQAAVMLAVLRKVRAHVERHFEDVGDRFPEEVRRIHHGEAKPRGVHGQASLAEVRDLLEEGIAVRPLPDVPDLDG